MLEFIVVFVVLLTSADASSCYVDQSRAMTYLDVAKDAIKKAFNLMPSCSDDKKTDCYDWYVQGHKSNGIYPIWPLNRLLNKSIEVYCDMQTDGGGWTVIQKRDYYKRPTNFYGTWNDYKTGFGDLMEQFWLGNDYIYALTNLRNYTIRFDMLTRRKEKLFARYEKFWIDDEFHKYMIHIYNFIEGDAEDGMRSHNHMKFSTRDQDNDAHYNENCAVKHRSAWWFSNCYDVDFNAQFQDYTEMKWFEHILIQSQMKIKPSV